MAARLLTSLFQSHLARTLAAGRTAPRSTSPALVGRKEKSGQRDTQRTPFLCVLLKALSAWSV